MKSASAFLGRSLSSWDSDLWGDGDWVRVVSGHAFRWRGRWGRGSHVVDLVVVVPTERSPLALMKFFKVPARERSEGRVHFGEGAGSHY